MLVQTTTSAPQCRTRVYRPRGFTLVELVVTLVIIGVLAAASAPVFFTQQTFAEHGFANETRAGMRYAQKLAVSSGCSVRVQFSGNGFALRRSGNSANCNDGAYTQSVVDPSNLGAQFTRTAPTGATVSAAPASFVFEPSGGIAGGASVTITLSGGLAFDIAGSTGYVQ